MDAVGYEQLLESMLSTATVLDATVNSPCLVDFIPDVKVCHYNQRINKKLIKIFLNISKSLSFVLKFHL